MGEERKYLTKEEAVAMLPDSEYVHTFRQIGGALIGADWDRQDVIGAFDKYPPELSGPAATNMDHGIVIRDDAGYLFIETAVPDGAYSEA